MEQIKIKTMLHNTLNIFALTRLNVFDRGTVQREYTFDIKECSVSERNDSDDNYILRLQAGDKKFFLHKARTVHYNQDLVKAVFSE